MSKITDIKEIRTMLADNNANGGSPAGLGIAKQIADFFSDKYKVYVEPLADWERELMRPVDPTPWHISKDGDVIAKFVGQDEAGAYLINAVGNSPANIQFGIIYNSHI